MVVPGSEQGIKNRNSNPEIIEIGYTRNPRYAAREPGMTDIQMSDAIHRLKEGAGLRGGDNLLFHLPSGDVYFNGEIIGNLHDD